MQEPACRNYQRLPFDPERCTVCGECFHHCPVMASPLERARQEMERPLAGRDSPVLRRCTSCLACNQFCPADRHEARGRSCRHQPGMRRQSEKTRFVLPLPHPHRRITALFRA
jgi:ferredoxin